MRSGWSHLLPLLLVPIAGVSTGYALRLIELQTRADVESTLQTVLATTQGGLRIWAREQKRRVAIWARSPGVEEAAVAQLRVTRTLELLRRSPAGPELEHLLQPALELNAYLGFVLVDRDGVVIAASEQQGLAQSTLTQLDPLTFSSAWNGVATLGLPFRVSNPKAVGLETIGPRTPIMLVAAPVRDSTGIIRAVLAFIVDPSRDFSRTAQLGRTGTTGETYVFDRNGRLLTESRFDVHLQQIGLVPPAERGILTVEIRDPGGNLLEGFRPSQPRNELPLTRMAQSAVAGQSGHDLEGYRDYRGVPVVGAWTWDSELGLGLTTEIDVAEAYRTLRQTRRLTLVMLGVVIAGAFGVIALIWNRARRLGRSLAREHASERGRHALLQDLDAVVWQANPVTWKLSFVTHRGAALLGYPVERWLSDERFLTNTLYPEDRERFSMVCELAASTTTLQRIQHRMLAADGTVVWFLTTLHLVESGPDRRRRLQGLMTNITAQKEAENALRLLVEVTGAASEALSVREITDRCLKTICQFRGWPVGQVWIPDESAQLLVCDAQSFYADRDVTEFRRASLATPLRKGIGLPGRVWQSRSPAWITDVTTEGELPRSATAAKAGLKTGVSMAVSQFAFPVTAGSEPMVRCVFEFFTSEALPPDASFLEALGQLGYHLNIVFERRRAEDERDRLFQEARAAVQVRDEFLSVASHELKTPLTVMKLQLETLRAAAQRSTGAAGVSTLLSKLDVVDRQIVRLTDLVNNLLDISRIIASSLPVDLKQDVDLSAVVRSTAERFSDQIERAGCVLQLQLAAGATGCWDPIRLEQVVANLLSNAIKYGFGKPIEVVVEAEPSVVWLSIRDHGIGISPGMQARIFERFERAVSEREYGGMGVGLWIVRQVVLALHGEVSVESKPREGSTFKILLPRQQPSAAKEAPDQRDEDAHPLHS